jgi:hypothetical protein
MTMRMPSSYHPMTMLPALDIAYTASQLARHFKNFTEKHSQIADRVISHLYFTRNYAVEYSGRRYLQPFLCSSDALFGDDIETESSSGRYLFQLYGGLIDWRAPRQATVTTSSTEAKLLSLSAAARETIWRRQCFATIHFATEQEFTIFATIYRPFELLRAMLTNSALASAT